MNYTQFMQQPEDERQAIFVDGADALRTSPANIEKDFWICFVLNALFAQRPKTWPAMYFRGGTSLSKAFGLIDRFSEDVDVAMERATFIPDTLATLESMDDPDRFQRLEELNDRATQFVRSRVAPHLVDYFSRAIPNAEERPTIAVSKADLLTLEAPYRAITRGRDGYVRAAVRLEFSIRAALTPNTAKSVTPYITPHVPGAEMTIAKVPTISAHRTFWDKFLIAQEIKDRFSKNNEAISSGERVSRHYYDLYKLIQSQTVGVNERQFRLARSCQRHSTLFYPTPGVDTSRALPGKFDVIPDQALRAWLARDFAQMAVMVFGAPPEFDEILADIERFQGRVNTTANSRQAA
jgi:hypothetical protein